MEPIDKAIERFLFKKIAQKIANYIRYENDVCKSHLDISFSYEFIAFNNDLIHDLIEYIYLDYYFDKKLDEIKLISDEKIANYIFKKDSILFGKIQTLLLSFK